MKHVLVLFVSLFSVVVLGSTEARNWLIRSFRMMEDLSVNPKMFKTLAEEQLCKRYYVHMVDGKVLLVPLKEWKESITFDVSTIDCVDTKEKASVPFSYVFEVIEATEVGEYRVTQLEPKKLTFQPIAYVKVPEGKSFQKGDVVTCKVLPLARGEMVSKTGSFDAYRMLSEEEADSWREASAGDLYNAYKAGATFVVKTRTHKVDCTACKGSGVDQLRYQQEVQKIERKASPKRRSLKEPSKSDLLKALNKKKPSCKACKGARTIMMEEFRRLKANS